MRKEPRTGYLVVRFTMNYQYLTGPIIFILVAVLIQFASIDDSKKSLKVISYGIGMILLTLVLSQIQSFYTVTDVLSLKKGTKGTLVGMIAGYTMFFYGFISIFISLLIKFTTKSNKAIKKDN